MMSFLLHVTRCLTSSFMCLPVYLFMHASGHSFAHPHIDAFVVIWAEMILTDTLASTLTSTLTSTLASTLTITLTITLTTTLQTMHCRDDLQRHIHLP